MCIRLRRQRPAHLVHGEQAGPLLLAHGQHRRGRAVLPGAVDGFRHAVVPPAKALLGPRAEAVHVAEVRGDQLLAARLLPLAGRGGDGGVPVRFRLGAGKQHVRAAVQGQNQHGGHSRVLLRADRLLPGGAVHVHRAPHRQLQQEEEEEGGCRPEEDAEEAANLHAGLLRQLPADKRVPVARVQRQDVLLLAQLRCP